MNQKFRAWSEEQSKYINTSHLYLKINGEFNILDSTVMEMYIGAEDNEKTEMCQGDILKIQHKDWIEPSYHVIEWSESSSYPAFELTNWESEEVNAIALVLNDFYSVVVAGNIHENAELLRL